MSHSELNQLTRAEELFDDGKLDEALEILNDWNQFKGLDLQRKGYFQFLKGLILIYQNKYEELIELGEQMFKEGQKLNENLQSLDGLYFIIFGLGLANKFDKALKKIGKVEALMRLFTNVSENILIQREARISVLKAWINLRIVKPDLAEECIEWIFNSQQELGNTFEIVWANLIMTEIMVRIKSRYNLAMEYTKKALLVAKEIKFNHFWIGYCYLSFGVIYSSIGEFNISLKYYMKCLKIFKEINNSWYFAMVLNNIGSSYAESGDYDLALKYLEESLELYEQLPETIFNIESPLDGLISVSLEKGDIERAQKYFHRLENIYFQKRDSNVELVYQYNKALMLKRSTRIRDKAKAEELLKHIIETESLFFDLIIKAHIHLCDLLLAEFQINNNYEVLEEINNYIAKLLTIAEKSHSYLVFCETYILQAKLFLLSFNVKTARRFLTQAQKIAESYGIKRLALKISYEHDELLRQLNIWERLKKSDASLTERWSLAGLSEQMENMVRKRIIEAPKISEEVPVSIFIITEGGTPLFSHLFIDQTSFESHLFSGFLTTIDYFIREMFSEGLDRATFGEHTLLLKSIPPFFIAYIFKGDSYHALQKLNYFIDNIQKQDEIWQNLIKYFKVNQSIHLKDIPLLESLITEVFITKSIVFSEL